jgi:hypothetical protein
MNVRVPRKAAPEKPEAQCQQQNAAGKFKSGRATRAANRALDQRSRGQSDDNGRRDVNEC